MSAGNIKRQVRFVLFCTLFYAAASFLLRGEYKRFTVSMFWNFFLAALPMLFALGAAHALCQDKTKTAWLYGILWLIFFPNSPYMVTDCIHLSNVTYFTRSDFINSAEYVRDLPKWGKLFYIGLGLVFAVLLGLQSLKILSGAVKSRWGTAASTAVVVTASLAGGYAVYIGRFLRFNSWDILNPLHLLFHLAEDFDMFTLQFSLMVAAFIFACYQVFRCFTFPEERDSF